MMSIDTSYCVYFLCEEHSPNMTRSS